MLTQCRKYLSVPVGESVGQVTIVVDGQQFDLVPVSRVAQDLGYSKRYVRRLCDEGKLIAIKLNNHWWVAYNAVELVPQADVLECPLCGSVA